MEGDLLGKKVHLVKWLVIFFLKNLDRARKLGFLVRPKKVCHQVSDL